MKKTQKFFSKLSKMLIVSSFSVLFAATSFAQSADEMLRDPDFYFEVNPQNLSKNIRDTFETEIFELVKNDFSWYYLNEFRYDFESVAQDETPNIDALENQLTEILLKNGGSYAYRYVSAEDSEEDEEVSEEELDLLYETCLATQTPETADEELCEELAYSKPEENLTYQELFIAPLAQTEYQEIFRTYLEAEVELNENLSSEVLEGVRVFTFDFGGDKYSGSFTFSYTYLEGNVVIGDEEYVKDLVRETKNCDSTCAPKLVNNEKYQKIQNSLGENNLLKAYAKDGDVFMKELYEEMWMYGLAESDMGLEEMGVSLAQTSEGLELRMHTNQNEEFLAEMDVNFDDLPEMDLFEKLPTENVVFALDTVTASEGLKLLENDPLMQEVLTEITMELSTILDREITNEELMNLFGEELAMVAQIRDLGEEEELPLFGNYLELNGETKVFDFTFVSKLGENQEMAEILVEQMMLELEMEDEKMLTLEILNDRYLVFSTNRNISAQFGNSHGLPTNIAKYFQKPNASGAYLDPEFLKLFMGVNLGVQFYPILGDEVSAEDKEHVEELYSKLQAKNFEMLDLAFEPFGAMTANEVLSNNYSKANFVLRFDEEKLLENYLAFADLMAEAEALENEYNDLLDKLYIAENELEEIEGDRPEQIPAHTEFADVLTADWFADAVLNLTKLGIIEGYTENGVKVFKPGQEITRAEFVKLALEAMEEKGNEILTAAESVDFETNQGIKDIDINEWYSDYVVSAFIEGIINGNPDGNFYPNQNINRAEAAEIIGNIIEKYDYESIVEMDAISFEDIPAGHWAEENITKIQNMGIMNGREPGKFVPAGNLNRAEAAVIIDRFLENITVVQ